MSEEKPQPSIEEVPFSEAVVLVGRKPDGSERKDLITYWGFAEKSWRWCIDTKMTLDQAIKSHQILADEIKIVVGKKGSIEKVREKDEKKSKADAAKEEKRREKEEKEQTKTREKEEKERAKEEKKEEERRQKDEKREQKNKKGEVKESAGNTATGTGSPATSG